MTCVDCHNPHGSFKPGLMRMANANEPGCFKCHGDKRGPFTFEHAPVREEGCQSCHMPHGSANAKMLIRQEVRLVCLECHANLPVPNTTRHRDRRRSPGISRSDFAALPQLHHLPPEDSRQPHRQEPAAMKRLLLLIASQAGFSPRRRQPLRQLQPRRQLQRPHPAAAASPVPSEQPAALGIHRSRLSLGHRRLRQLRHLSHRSSISAPARNCWAPIHHSQHVLAPNTRFFDRIDVRAYDWGDDPYSTLHLDVRKAKLYNFSGDYRNIAYYNNLPGFADPLLGPAA